MQVSKLSRFGRLRTCEDLRTASAAGLYETVLNVRSEQQLVSAIKFCWASLYEPRVISYLQRSGGVARVSMGLILQAMVRADCSGVVFTTNPMSGDPTEMVINAAWGLGQSIADGRVSPDTFRVDRLSGVVRDRAIGMKSVRLVADREGLREEEVARVERGRASISDAAIAELVQLSARVEQQFKGAQDIEWAMEGGDLYVLQARPVSATAAPKRKKRKDRGDIDRSTIVWSNVNVGEALPGVATPLTWSVLSRFSDLGFKKAFGSLGCSVPRGSELVGNFRGRIYLNMSEFMSILSQVPGLRPSTLLSLGGGGELARLEAQTPKRGSLGFWLKLPRTATRFVAENYRLRLRVEDLERLLEDERGRYRGVDLRILSPSGLGKTLRDVEHILERTGTVMLTCYGNLLGSAVVLRSVLRGFARHRSERLERDLMTGLADVQSAAPGLALYKTAEIARTEPVARAAIVDGDPRVMQLRDLPDGPTRRALERLVATHGFRGPREAELYEPRWRENPSMWFSTLRAHLQTAGERPLPADLERQQRTVRERASVQLDQLVPLPLRVPVRRLVSLVQHFTRLREQLRAYVTEVLGIYREVALDASRRLVVSDSTVRPDAAFFLTVDELHAVLAGELDNVSALVRRRHQQYQRDLSLPDPPGTFVGYPPDGPPAVTSADVLAGLAASSGLVEGRARVLHKPQDSEELVVGEILVVPSADVGWSPLFTVASALVTDLGGPLSHASIVAREYGLPAVVNVEGGTRRIETGDWLVVDGDAGSVRVCGRRD